MSANLSIEDVFINFKNCDAGWIRFTVNAGAQSVPIHASHIYDPFPDLFGWMKAIRSGSDECFVTIDQEGLKTTLVARKLPHDEDWLFLIHDDQPSERLRAVVSPRQLIKTFYCGIRNFARSAAYVPKEWEAETLGERFCGLLPGWDEVRVEEDLAELDREELGDAIFNAAPVYKIHFPNEPDEKKEFSRVISYFMDRDDPVNSAGLYEEPDRWDIPVQYDAWSPRRRRAFLLEQLREKVNSWDGCKLQELESEAIEAYLGCSGTADGSW